MKNRDEYLESIYAKRDSEIIKHKKRVSVLTSVLCLGVCFASVFAFLPKYFDSESFINKSKNSDNKIFSEYSSSSENMSVSDELFTFCVTYPAVYNESHLKVTDSIGNAEMNDKEVTVTNEKNSTTSDIRQQTEIAAESPEETKKGNYSGNDEGIFDPDSFYSKPSFGISGEIAPEKNDNFNDVVTEPFIIPSDSESSKQTLSSTSAKFKSPEEAIAEAMTAIPEEDAAKNIDDKTHVTINRTASGKSTYTVYLYTENKSFAVELDAVTLEIIECKEKEIDSGNVSYYSTPHIPEPTEALPAYVPE